ncbi:MAG: hypothetical protein H0W06_08840 [Chloroflexia bacterium]|nr:hypothetical protein [Chloroflexia bacterium]
MPNHIFRGTVLTHLRTATAHPLDDAMFAAIFSQWEGEDGQARYMRNLERFDERYTEEFEPLSAWVHVWLSADVNWRRPEDRCTHRSSRRTRPWPTRRPPTAAVPRKCPSVRSRIGTAPACRCQPR